MLHQSTGGDRVPGKPPLKTQGPPFLIGADGSHHRLEPVLLAAGNGHDEAWLQGLLHAYPDIMPIGRIEPGFGQPVAAAREVACGHGYIDNLFLTPAGDIIVVETKLWRNPQARREVIAQALDYVAALGAMDYASLQAAVLKAGCSATSLYGLVEGHADALEEGPFFDAVAANLKRGRMLVLAVGDGIRQEAASLAGLLQHQVMAQFTFALVEIRLFRNDGTGDLVAIPDMLVQTVMIERGILTFDAGAPVIKPAPAKTASAPKSITEDMFYEAVDARHPGLSVALKAFLAEVAALGVYPDFQASLNLKIDLPDAPRSVNVGYIQTNGQLCTNPVSWHAGDELAIRYAQTLADLIGGKVALHNGIYVSTNGSAMPFNRACFPPISMPGPRRSGSWSRAAGCDCSRKSSDECPSAGRRREMMRTSQAHPLEIAVVESAHARGRIGITFCPGKRQPDALTGGWDRDLCADLDRVRAWGAAAVVTLIEPHEIEQLGVTGLGAETLARHMDWLHLPIRDVSVPGEAFEAAWTSAGEGLRARLRDGFDVLVHCKGGLGRAGLVATRLLIELGEQPQDAVTKVRAARPGAIETRGQLDHVMNCTSLVEVQPKRDSASIADRARGALLGLAVGDAVGTTVEFRPRDSFPLVIDMVGGGPFSLQPGQWTDDTAMALALADSLLNDAGLDEVDLMERFCRWHEQGAYSCTGTCFDIGITTRQALDRWRSDGNPVAGSTHPNSAGNGSLMRLAPVAIRHWNDAHARRDVAARQGATTHGAQEAIDACVYYADVLAAAIAGEPRSRVLSMTASGLSPDIEKIAHGSWRGRPRDRICSSGYVVHTLEAALWCVGRTGDFRSAVLAAANLGDDADTTAAVTGQLAGALYGASGIPAEWLGRLAWRDRISAIAEELVKGGRSLSIGFNSHGKGQAGEATS
ncbi:MAG: ADP-ribosylglycohydrolase family protein [Novosphingobium sp.]